MAKINLYRILKEEFNNNEFKRRLREAVEKFVPDTKLDMDKLFDAILERLEYYDRHTMKIDDKYVEVEGK